MPQFLKAGVLSFHGAFISVAIVLMILYAFYYASKKKYNITQLMYITPAAIFFGFAGARLLYVTVCDQLYVEQAEKWRLTDGGYSLFGAAAGVLLTVLGWWLITGRRHDITSVLDTVFASAPVAIFLGRFGSIFSGDCLGGIVENERLTVFPVSIYSPVDGSYHYAVFFYEAVYCALIFLVIKLAEKKFDRKGVASYLFVVLYCCGRALFESMRTDSMYIGFVRIGQAISGVVAIAMFIYMNIKLVKRSGFRYAYLISYAVFFAAFYTVFYSEFYMYSTSKVINTVQIMIGCFVIMVLNVLTGWLYLTRPAGKKTVCRVRWETKNAAEDVLIRKKNIAKSIVLSILTLGIYHYYWKYVTLKNIKAIRLDKTGCLPEMLLLIFVPVYPLYWWYTRGEFIRNRFTSRGFAVKSRGITFVIFSALSLGIVDLAIAQSDFNSLPGTEEALLPEKKRGARLPDKTLKFSKVTHTAKQRSDDHNDRKVYIKKAERK